MAREHLRCWYSNVSSNLSSNNTSGLTPADITDMNNLPSITPEQVQGFCDA